MDKNIYLDFLQKGLQNSKDLSVDSIENLLGHIADLHNTMGKSYEYLADVVSGLVKAQEENKAKETSLKKMKEYEKEIEDLKSRVRNLEEDLRRARAKTEDFEKDAQKKEEIIQDLKQKLEKVNEKPVFNSQKSFSFLKSLEIQKDKDKDKDNDKDKDKDKEKEKKKEKEKEKEKEEPFRIEEITTNKRKFDDLAPSDLQFDIEEEGERSKSSSTTMNKKDDSNGGDDYKFKKVFKKVKRNETNNNNNKHSKAHGLTSSNHFLSVYNENKTSEFSGNRVSQVNFDEDMSLENLLNNFVEAKENNTSKSNTGKLNVGSKKDEVNLSVDKEKFVSKSDSSKIGFLDANNSSKVYKKNAGLAFSQKSPLKSLELSETNISGPVPITRNGRNGNKKETNSNLMQRMMIGTKKRNSIEPSNNMFKMSGKKNESDQKPSSSKDFIDDEDLVRTTHRTKLERENLQGFDCDQCSKFYNFIADGIHIKSASQMCDKCSRHRDKFPLPSTPENFHLNFTLNSQD